MLVASILPNAELGESDGNDYGNRHGSTAEISCSPGK
jgi:hypothetical protein